VAIDVFIESKDSLRRLGSPSCIMTHFPKGREFFTNQFAFYFLLHTLAKTGRKIRGLRTRNTRSSSTPNGLGTKRLVSGDKGILVVLTGPG
jgi:hypothetical protein